MEWGRWEVGIIQKLEVSLSGISTSTDTVKCVSGLDSLLWSIFRDEADIRETERISLTISIANSLTSIF
jgi:hypothetical protein